MKLESYWLDTAPAFTAGAEGPVAGRADVVVVGAGFTGLSAALALARRGASVTVLETGRVVGEASGRNGGHCNSGLAHDFGALAARLGVDKARAFYRLTMRRSTGSKASSGRKTSPATSRVSAS